jgi:hypothetical protein
LDTTRNNNSISTNGLQGSPTPTDAQQQQQQQQPADNLNLARVDSKGTDISLSLSALKSGAHPNDISIHMLSLLYDPPVQGCELRPYVSVVDSFGRVSAVNTDEAAQALDFRYVCVRALFVCSPPRHESNDVACHVPRARAFRQLDGRTFRLGFSLEIAFLCVYGVCTLVLLCCSCQVVSWPEARVFERVGSLQQGRDIAMLVLCQIVRSRHPGP